MISNRARSGKTGMGVNCEIFTKPYLGSLIG
jgi:hypothetical protein